MVFDLISSDVPLVLDSIKNIAHLRLASIAKQNFPPETDGAIEFLFMENRIQPPIPSGGRTDRMTLER
jgi:hypothetical protein